MMTMVLLWLVFSLLGANLANVQMRSFASNLPGQGHVRLSYLLVQAAKFLVENRQVFTDRVRKLKGKGKEKGAGKGNPPEPGRKGKKGNGKGKAPGATPKMAAGLE